MPKLKLVILDYDETLVENSFDFYEAYCQALSTHGLTCIPYDEFIFLLRQNRLPDLIPGVIKQESFWRVFRRLYRSKHSILRRGLREFLVIMKNFNVSVVVISGREGPSWDIQRELINHGVAEYIDEVLTLSNLEIMGFHEEFLFDKSRLIHHAKQRYGAFGDHASLCVGDYITDYISCKKAGSIFIGINTFPERNIELKKHGVEYTAKDFYDVLLIIYNLGLLK
ncbi:MAG: HAD hydrolase-like protein [Desulfurococcaceae archaeon]